jgi:NitT/TauT family transport system permease protein
MNSAEQVRMREEQAAPGAALSQSPPRRRRDVADRVLGVLLPAITIVALFAIWQGVVVFFHVSSFIFPRLDDTLASLRAHWPTIWSNLQITLQEAAIGFVIGNALAILGATLFVHSRWAERALYPVAVLIQVIPIVVWSPILVIVLNGLLPQIAVAILISFFPSLVNMTRGLRSVDPLALELFHVLNASRWQVFRKLRWPAAIPALFSSLRITSTLSLVGAIVGEYVAGGGQGVGYALILAKQSIDTAQVMAITLVISMTGIVIFLAIAGIERVVLGRRGQANL